jgi:hypothetical protein
VACNLLSAKESIVTYACAGLCGGKFEQPASKPNDTPTKQRHITLSRIL